jgi:DNA-binding NarL/FixJ family response regulator
LVASDIVGRGERSRHRTRVLIVDDHPMFRDGLAGLLASVDGVEVAGTAADGGQAVERAAEGDVDVVLMDLNLPGMSGVEATACICAATDPPAVLAVTMVDDDDTVIAAMRAGATGYVLKGASGAEIVAAVNTVASGGAVFSRGAGASDGGASDGNRTRVLSLGS